jgi:hypothetical protein
MLSHPHAGGKRVDKGHAKQSDQAGFSLQAPQPTYDGVTYVIETEKLQRPPMSQAPDGGVK